MASDSAYDKYKAYIAEIHHKVKARLVSVAATIQEGLKEELQCTERKLGLFLELLEEVGKESYSDTSSASRSSPDDELEFDLAIKSSQFDDSNLYDLSCLQKFNKEINSWFRTQLHDFTRATSSLGGLGSGSESPEAMSVSQDSGNKRMRRVGLEVDVQNLSRTLIHDEHNKLILIVGEKGIGKTTLAMEVYQNNMVSHHFQVRAWVNLSRSFVRREVLQNIFKEIPQEFLAEKIDYSLASTRELAALLGNVSKNTRCLLVLDGLRTPKAWKELREILPLRFCRIMITTRYKDLAKVEGSSGHIVHEMRALSDQEGWELFKAKVHVPAGLEQLGKKIVRKCVGLPLEILTTGDVLLCRDATEELWLTVLHEYVNPRHKLVSEISAAAENLEANLKQCLSCLELFNEEYDIPMRRLIVYWVAEGLVKQENGSSETPEVIAERYLMEFIKHNFIQAAKWKLNGKLKTCRMNYFLRNTWLEKAKKENFVADNKKKLAPHKSFPPTGRILLSLYGIPLNFHDKKKKKSSGTCKILRLADNLNHKDKSFSHIHGLDNNISSSSYRQYYGDLRAFVSFDTREGPVPGDDVGKFLRGCIAAKCFKNLRIIDLEGTFRPKLPDTIGELIQLRYLGLRHTYLELLPSSIGKLVNLQTLDLKHSCVKSIPCSIWKLQQLRHLYLSENYRSKMLAPPSTSSLVEMQTLWGAYVDEEANIDKSLHSSINIRKLGLAYRLTLPQQKLFAEWISKLKHLSSLRLRSIDDMVCPSNLYLKPLSGLNRLSSVYLLGRLDNPLIVKEFPLSLTEITLSISGISQDPMPSLEKLPNLSILNLYAGSYTGKIMVCSSGGFPVLRVLNLWKLTELEDWIVEDEALPILRDLEIRSCINLRMVPQGLRYLRHCNELKLTKMSDEFKARVVANQGQDWQYIAHIPSVVIKN